MVVQLIDKGIWPLAVVIIAIAALLILRAPFAGVLNRIRKIDRGGTAIDLSEHTTEKQQAQIQSESAKPPAQIPNNIFLGPPSPTVDEVEKNVDAQLSAFNESPDITIKRLVRAFAITMIHREFEVIYRLIFGSQLELILLANAGAVNETVARDQFEGAKARFPEVHKSATQVGEVAILYYPALHCIRHFEKRW
jgi:hypothetical protein